MRQFLLYSASMVTLHPSNQKMDTTVSVQTSPRKPLLHRYFVTNTAGAGSVSISMDDAGTWVVTVELLAKRLVFDVENPGTMSVGEAEHFARLAIAATLKKRELLDNERLEVQPKLHPWIGDLNVTPFGGPTIGWEARAKHGQPTRPAHLMPFEADVQSDGHRRYVRRRDTDASRKIVRRFQSMLSWGPDAAASLLQRAGYEQKVVSELMEARGDRRRKDRRAQLV